MAARIIGVIVRKGGTGKTITAIQLSHMLAVSGYRVLHVDMDSQSNSSTLLMGDMEYEDEDFHDLVCTKLNEKQVLYDRYICESAYDNIDCIPANNTLDAVLDSLYDISKSNPYVITYLAYNLSLLCEDYDYIILDTNASSSRLNQAAMCACTGNGGILTPIRADYFSYKGVADLLSLIMELRRAYGLDIRYMGMFFVDVSRNTNNFTEVYNHYLNNYGDYFIPVSIRHSEFINKSTNVNLPLLLLDKRHGTTEDYMNLLRELGLIEPGEHERCLRNFLRKRRTKLSSNSNDVESDDNYND